ncbi:hypothetical protein U9K52_01700 [Chryseobacterium sp. MHB01]|uniref:hypothetical protein n=1 Tax=unclassified Chryseobacterium TaxID=2593645 RepID=UPI002AFEF679|nr:hypothetical protein [Chryseobacterium sp. MHB01]MEA1847612.1 hypothetical protein [Chryseobacterium sp. MHB01]
MNIIIKRILFLTLLYAAVTVVMTLTRSQEKSFIPILIAINIVFAVLLTLLIYTYFRFSKQNTFPNKDQLPRNPISHVNNNFDSKSVFKISQQPFLFGLEKGLISNKDFYYDQDFFYAVDEAGAVSTYNLTDISELSGTATQINNSRIWQLKIIQDSETVEYRFAHNFSIWNKNFLNFYYRVKQIRPEAIKSKWSLWRM